MDAAPFGVRCVSKLFGSRPGGAPASRALPYVAIDVMKIFLKKSLLCRKVDTIEGANALNDEAAAVVSRGRRQDRRLQKYQ